MIRFFLIFLIIGVILWLALPRCTNVSQNTLIIQPAASFPKEKHAILGQNVARILPKCPGFQKLGAVLEFTDIAEEEDAVLLSFSAPDNPQIPAEWKARGQQCVIRVARDAAILGPRAACQALCLGEPGVEGQDARIELGGKQP